MDSSKFSADTVFVQLFTDGPHQFVMVDEMKRAIKGTPCPRDPKRNWYTIDANIARAMAERSGRDIRFLPIRLSRTEHAALPVMCPNGTHCILAVDALFEFLHFMVLELKVFQNSTDDKMKKFVQFCSTIDEYLEIETKSQFFLPTKRVEELYQLAAYQFSVYSIDAEPSTRSIPKQLIHLGLIRQQSDIRNYPGLASLDFSDPEITLHQCILVCLLKKFKSLGAFVHNQKGCHRLLSCRVCLGGNVQEEIPEGLDKYLRSVLIEAENTHDQLAKMKKEMEEKMLEKPKESKKAEVKSKKQKPIRKVLETPMVPKVVPERSEVAAPVAAPSQASKPTPPPPTPAPTCKPSKTVQKPKILETPKPKDSQESKVCPKCIRTSDHCKKAKEELKGANNEIKKLKKTLSESEKALEQEMKQRLEAEEELRVLREQMEQMKKAQQVVKVPEPSPEVLELKKNLANFQDKLHIVQDQDPIHKATQQVTRLITISDNEEVKDRSRLELLKVQMSYNEYTNALENNINNIQIVLNNAPKLLPVPEYPELPPVFFKELQKAEDAKNKELEQECVICHDAVDEKKEEDLFQCPECNKKVHLTCVSKWWEINDSCPHCRAEWK